MAADAKRARLSGAWHHGVVGAVLVAHGFFFYVLKQQSDASPATDAQLVDFVALTSPLMVLAVLVEAAGTRRVRLNDSIQSLNTGALSELFKKLTGSLLAFSPYVWVYQHLAVTRYFATPSLLGWFAMFLLIDFCYYWVHRTGHTVRAFWAMHGVHHSSEEYNLTTALRQSTLHGYVSWLFYLPLALLFPPTLFYYHAQFNLLYQFWIHTECIGKLGPLEWLLNTPSQHRVHHGRNKYCIDTNYGGTLCIFDRLFGTFAEERDDEPPVYGLTHSLNTFCPVKANTHMWLDIWTAMRALPGAAAKFFVLYNGPGWIPGTDTDNARQYPIPRITARSAQKYDPKYPQSVSYYLGVHMLMYLVLHLIAVDASPAAHPYLLYLLVPYLTLFSLAFGCLLDRRNNVLFVEAARLAGGILVLYLVDLHPFVQIANAALAIGSVVFLVTARHQLSRPIQPSELGMAGCDD